ncbi:MAG: hypothetical protein GC191_06285 [Azospirillum sp.]|nr:hypothetical protein [Azospirillum sp.]
MTASGAGEPEKPGDKPIDRRQREARALRENLLKRKLQQRERGRPPTPLASADQVAGGSDTAEHETQESQLDHDV